MYVLISLKNNHFKKPFKLLVCFYFTFLFKLSGEDKKGRHLLSKTDTYGGKIE